MGVKGNLIENWDRQYESLSITYNEKVDNPIDLAEQCGREFLHEDILNYLPHPEKVKILEVGCGGARNSLYLALRGFEVSCADFSPEAVRLGQANFSAFGATGNFLADDLMHSQIPAASFDCVMSFGLLEHFEDLPPLVASLTRLVRPGGIQIHIVIPKKFSTQSISNVIWFPYRFLYYALKKRDFKDIIRKSYRDFPHYENSFSAQEYSRAFEAGGNEILRCEPRDVLLPLMYLPLKVGNILVRKFPDKMMRLIKRTNRTHSKLLHFLSPAFCIVCRRKQNARSLHLDG
jgi:SAM-dependent methyltransferase